MNSIADSILNPIPAEPELWIGFDWGGRQHAFALQDRSGYKASGTLPHSPESLHQWLQELGSKYRAVTLAIEGSPDFVMPALTQYPWLTIYPVNPVTSERFRKAFKPSGATDDGPAAELLLDLVRAHAGKLRAWQGWDAPTQKLLNLTQARREMVDRRTQVMLQLGSVLKSFYPQALGLVGELDSVLAVECLRRWPDLLSLKAAKPATIKRFYYQHNIRSAQLVEKRLTLIREAVALTDDDLCVSVGVLKVQQLVDELAVFQKHIPVLDKAIRQAFAEHPDAHLFRDLPGAGAQMAPRLCAAFGSDRERYPTAQNLQKYAGVAPVVEKSGQQKWVHWRWNAPKFLRQTMVEWAGLSVRWSVWATAYYEAMARKGKKHAVIIRALAFKWLRILWKCWQTQSPYDEPRYLAALARRGSPYAK